MQTEKAGDVEGVSIIRTATLDGESTGVHLTYFFAGDSRYLIDCITEPDELEKVDGEIFKPPLASVRIDPPSHVENGEADS